MYFFFFVLLVGFDDNKKKTLNISGMALKYQASGAYHITTTTMLFSCKTLAGLQRKIL